MAGDMRTLLLTWAELYQGVADHVSLALLALGPFSHLAVSLGRAGSSLCYWQCTAQAA